MVGRASAGTMMCRNSLYLCLMAGLLVACAQRPQSFTPTAQQASIQVEKSYQLGQVTKAYIGAQMIRVQKYAVKSSGVAIPDRSFVMTPWGLGLGGFGASGGASYRISGTITHDGQTFYVVPISATGVIAGQGAALVRLDGTIYDHPLVSGGVIAPDSYTISPAESKFQISQAKDYAGIGGDQNFELVFSGITNGSIRILYREYTDNNLARPAFSQELSYDRAATQVRFRDYVFQIAKASNEEIEFSVVSD